MPKLPAPNPDHPILILRMMELSTKILIVNLLSTMFLVGLIWIVQVVHYPLFARVGTEIYPAYQSQHEKLITFVVILPMVIELVTSILLAKFTPPGVSRSLVIAGIVLVVLIWLSTAFLQVPCHAKLASGFDPEVHRRLVHSNWIRTIAWSARGVIVTWMLGQLLAAKSVT